MKTDRNTLKRYICSLAMIMLMVGAAELSGQREILFPEMAALVIGLWIVGKRVWCIRPWQMALFLPLVASFGVLIVRFSPLPLPLNVTVAFLFTAAMLYILRSSFYPMLSACILPVLLGTDTWVYPPPFFPSSLCPYSHRSTPPDGSLRPTQACCRRAS